jgi:hypothetical protein
MAAYGALDSTPQKHSRASADGGSEAHHRGDLRCLAHRDPLASLSPRTLWPSQHGVRLLPALGYRGGVWALVGRGTDRR